MFRGPKDISRVPAKCCESANKKGLPQSPICKCEFCGEGWESETEVHIHKKTHVIEIPETLACKQLCYHCIKTFETKSDLVKHIKTFHLLSSEDAQRVEREVFICDVCEQIFFNKSMLITHLALVHKLYLENYMLKCPRSKCKKYVACKSMHAHLYLHGIQSLMICPICFQKCSDLSEYQAHLKTHKKYFYCDICGATFTGLIWFKNHTAEHSKNPQIKQNRDSRCARYVLPSFERLFLYQKIRSHKGYRMQESFKICILCREICTNETESRKHIGQHYVLKSYRIVNEKNYYNCEKCGEEFTHKILLKKHETKCEVIRIYLGGEKKEKCEISCKEECEVPAMDY